MSQFSPSEAPQDTSDSAPERRPLWRSILATRVSLTTALLLIGVVVLAAASVRWVQLRNSWQLERVDAADLEAGKRPQSDWVEVRGKPLFAFAAQMDAAPASKLYIPLVSESWRPGMPVAVYLVVPENTLANLLHYPGDGYQGLIRRRGLPMGLAPDFEKILLPPRDPHYVIDYGTSPDHRFWVARNLTILGSAVLVLCAASGLVQALRQEPRD